MSAEALCAESFLNTIRLVLSLASRLCPLAPGAGSRSSWSARWSRRPARTPSSPPTTARRCCCGRTRSTPPAACSGGASSCACSTTAPTRCARGELYEQLIHDEKVDLLIGPFGSAATLLAAARGRARAARAGQRRRRRRRRCTARAPRYVFQTARSVRRLRRRRAARSRPRRTAAALFILARDDPASREMAEARARAAAQRASRRARSRSTAPARVDFAPQVAKARAAQAEAWIAFGDVRDAADMVKTFKKLGYAPRAVLRAAARPIRSSSRCVGQDAEFSLGAIEYDPRFGTPRQRALRQGLRAPSGRAPPGLRGGQGYAAGTVLAAAVRARRHARPGEAARGARRARDPTRCSAATRSTRRAASRSARKPALVQIRGGRPQVVWPQRCDRELLPYPAVGRAAAAQVEIDDAEPFLPVRARQRRAARREGADARRRRGDRRPGGFGRHAEKAATRKPVAEALARPRRGRGYVRVNAPSSPFCYGDLVATIHQGRRRRGAAQGGKRRRPARDRLADREPGARARHRRRARSTSCRRSRPRPACSASTASCRRATCGPTQGPWRVKRVAFGAADYAP